MTIAAGPLIGFLHTSPLHVATFDRLVRATSSEVQTSHLVDGALLDQARLHGADHGDVVAAVGRAIQQLADRAPDVIVCTCSTISAVAEAAQSTVPVIRIDRAMARAAVADGQRIAVVSAVDSTLSPTLALLTEEAGRLSRAPEIVSTPCNEAWPLFEAGDINGYHAILAAHVQALPAPFDVVVLAQASMLGVEQLVPERRLLVAPPWAVADALSRLQA